MKNRFKAWWYKLTHWEFWPWQVLYFPSIAYGGIYGLLKEGAITTFAGVNPCMPMGGLIKESKKDILEKLPAAYLPKACFFDEPLSVKEIGKKINEMGITYPLVIKPWYGERGHGVSKIYNQQQLTSYIQRNPIPVLVQEFLTEPMELGIFYVRMPSEPTGKVTSVVVKEFISVLGNGQYTVETLLLRRPRNQLYIQHLRTAHPRTLAYVPGKGESVMVEPIGNHCRGTVFRNGNHLIDKALNQVFDDVAKQVPGFYYGRFDIKCQSIEELKEGNFKIMELNGAKSEPAHIYEPGYPLWKAYRDIWWHHRRLLKIALENHANGFQYPTFREAWDLLKGK